jgi:hypothetical protein
LRKKEVENLKEYIKTDLFDSNDFSVMIGDQYANSLLSLNFLKSHFGHSINIINQDFSSFVNKFENYE